MRKYVVALLAAIVTALPATAFAAGVTGPAFYVDGELYRTVGTPTDLSNTGAPAHSFDTIYNVKAYQAHNVATAAPGDPGFNGGRWKVHLLTFTDYDAAIADTDVDLDGSRDLDSSEEIDAARAGGYISSDTIAAVFECPVIPVPRGR